MKVLMLSGDPEILKENTGSRRRMEKYSDIFGELHLVVMSGVKTGPQESGALFLYAASGNAVWRRIKLYLVAVKVLKKNKCDLISAQNPDDIGIVGFLLARRFNIPLQIQIHTDIMSSFFLFGRQKK